MNPDQIPTVSTFRVEKPGKSKFAPSIGGRKSTTNPLKESSTDLITSSVTASSEDGTAEPGDLLVVGDLEGSVSSVVAGGSSSASPLPSSSSTVGKKIESIQSRRLAATAPISISVNSDEKDQNIKMPSGPKDAASIATSSLSTSVTAEKRTMAYFLKDSGEGREMPNSSQISSSTASASASSDPQSPSQLSPSKTRRIVNLRNIKAPPRSAATSTALAPQVRVVDGAIVYDEKFSAAISIPSTTSDLEQELEYVDEDDENGKHLTSATYSTRAKGSNRWSQAECDLFYEALSMCGTDFSMVQTLFPHRTRPQIKGKYKLEEKSNPTRISSALKHRKSFDSSFKDRVKEFIESINKKK